MVSTETKHPQFPQTLRPSCPLEYLIGTPSVPDPDAIQLPGLMENGSEGFLCRPKKGTPAEDLMYSWLSLGIRSAAQSVVSGGNLHRWSPGSPSFEWDLESSPFPSHQARGLLSISESPPLKFHPVLRRETSSHIPKP